MAKPTISIKDINEAIRQGEISKANKLADEYIISASLPNSIRSYLQIAPWRKQNYQLADDQESTPRLAQSTKLHILAGPFETLDDLVYGLQRLSFYIAPFTSKITILSRVRLPELLPTSEDLDPSVPQTYKEYKAKGIFRRSAKPIANILARQQSDESLVLLDFSNDRSLCAELTKNSSHSSIKSYGVSAKSKNEGSLFIQSIYDYLSNHDTNILASRNSHSKRFANFVQEYKSDEVALVCNGPSVASLTSNRPFAKKLKAILCNTAFLNQDFKKYFSIIGLVFADPIFHYGISSYSATFRENVIAEFGNSNEPFFIIIPEKYAHIIFYYMPSISDKVIAVPHEKIDDFNHDLTSFFTAKTTANVLTFLMLPVGSSLAKTIYLFGVDGRPRSENQYFWSHDKNSQLSDAKMENIRTVHPSFFAINYNDYYDEHVEICANYSLALESAGYKLFCCTPTHIEPFQQRMLPNNYSVSLAATKTFISINPDAGKNHGHYVSHENMLNRAFISKGYYHVVLSNLNSSLLNSVDFKVIPTFSCPGSWMLKLDRFKNDFQHEFSTSFAKVTSELNPNSEIIVYMYLGSTKVATWICELMSNLPVHLSERTTIFVNCFNNIVDPKREEICKEISAIKSQLFCSNMHLSIDTAAARQDIIRLVHDMHSGWTFDIWPMISITDYSDIVSSLGSSPHTSFKLSNRVKPRKYAVYFSATSQRPKGIHIALEACLKLSSAFPNNRYAIRRSSHDIEYEVAQMYEESEKRSNIDIIYSTDSDIQYLQPFFSAEVSCITYDPAFFASKTSAVLLDSVACGCKVVCCKGTWISQELSSSRLRAYSFSQEQDLESYLKAIEIALSLKYDSFSTSTDFISHFNANNLLTYLSSNASRAAPH